MLHVELTERIIGCGTVVQELGPGLLESKLTSRNGNRTRTCWSLVCEGTKLSRCSYCVSAFASLLLPPRIAIGPGLQDGVERSDDRHREIVLCGAADGGALQGFHFDAFAELEIDQE